MINVRCLMPAPTHALPLGSIHTQTDQFEPFCAQESAKLMQRIDGLSDLQMRNILTNIVARKTDPTLDPQIQAIKALWEWQPPFVKTVAQKTALIRQTIDRASIYFSDRPNPFESESLRPGCAIERYMISHVREPMLQSVMQLFCAYLAELSTRDGATLRHHLACFPPADLNSEDLKCLPGTGERLNLILTALTTDPREAAFFYAHDVVIRRIIDGCKCYIYEGNEIHVPSYLYLALGLVSLNTTQKTDSFYTTPRRDFPAIRLNHALQTYASEVKTRIKSEAAEQIAERRRLFADACSRFPANSLVYDNSPQGKQNRIAFLELTGVAYSDLIAAAEDDESLTPAYQWDASKVAAAAVALPMVELLPAPQSPVQSDFRLNSRMLLRYEAPEAIATCIKEGSASEVLGAIDTLWALGEDHKNNYPILFAKTVRKLRDGDLERAASLLPSNHHYKLSRIRERIGYYWAHSELTHPNAGELKLTDLISKNAPFLDIMHCLRQPGGLSSNSFFAANVAQDNLLTFILRPDFNEVLQALIKRYHELPRAWYRRCFDLAVKHHETAAIVALLDNDQIGREIFADALVTTAKISQLLLARRIDLAVLLMRYASQSQLGAQTEDEGKSLAWTAAELNCPEIIQALIDRRVSKAQILRQSYDQTCPTWVAAERGHATVLEKLIQAGATAELFEQANNNLENGSPLSIAMQRGHVRAVKVMLKHGARPSRLMWKTGDIAAVIKTYREFEHLAKQMARSTLGARLNPMKSGTNADRQLLAHGILTQLLTVYDFDLHALKQDCHFDDSREHRRSMQNVQRVIDETLHHCPARGSEQRVIPMDSHLTPAQARAQIMHHFANRDSIQNLYRGE